MLATKKDLQAIRGALRTAFIRSDYKREFISLKSYKVDRFKANGELHKVTYTFIDCECCGANIKGSECYVDHIKPIGQYFDIDHTEGFIFRLWCSYDNLQILCKGCHDKKTAYERSLIKGYTKL